MIRVKIGLAMLAYAFVVGLLAEVMGSDKVCTSGARNGDVVCMA